LLSDGFSSLLLSGHAHRLMVTPGSMADGPGEERREEEEEEEDTNKRRTPFSFPLTAEPLRHNHRLF